MPRHFGHLPDVPEGATFLNRAELRDAKVHLPTQAGISGSATEGADSIVLSGGYEDDEDAGEIIVYTGEGGRDPLTGKQVKHQELIRGNLALALNHRDGLPVRVTRGSRHLSPYSPATGYQPVISTLACTEWRTTGTKQASRAFASGAFASQKSSLPKSNLSSPLTFSRGRHASQCWCRELSEIHQPHAPSRPSTIFAVRSAERGWRHQQEHMPKPPISARWERPIMARMKRRIFFASARITTFFLILELLPSQITLN